MVGWQGVVGEQPRRADVECAGDEVRAVGVEDGVPVLDPADGAPVDADGLGEGLLGEVAPHAQAPQSVADPVPVVAEERIGFGCGHMDTLE